MVVKDVGPLRGHLLILGGAASPDALFMAVAPFRSRLMVRDQALLPVVILDAAAPTGEVCGVAGWCAGGGECLMRPLTR
jgi:hypothetical protein